MSGQLQFGGTIPFVDRGTGQQVQVRVWGLYVGQGIDAHEEASIQQWIMNALATSAASYDGNVYELPSRAQEWGSWVSQQIGPGLAQAFQAQGQIQIQGVQIEGQGKEAPAKAAPMKAAPAKQVAMGAPAAAGDNIMGRAATALSQRMGVPPDQAQQAVAIVVEILQGAGVVGAIGVAPQKHDPYAKQPQKHDPHAKQPQKHDPYAKQPQKHDPYAKQPQKHDPYAKQPQKGAPAKQEQKWKK